MLRIYDDSSDPDRHKGYRPFLLLVLFLSLYFSYLVIRPFLYTLVFAIILASMFYPFQIYLVERYRGRENLAALTIVFIITFVIAIPVFFFVSAMVSQGVDSVNRINEWIKAGSIQKLSEDPRVLSYMTWAQDRVPFLDLRKLDIENGLLTASKNVGQFVLNKGAALLGDVANLLAHFSVMIFVTFYLVRDGKQMIQRVKFFSPLREDQEDRILEGIRLVAKSVLMGSFLTALFQGLAGGIGLAIVGIPGLFWGTVLGFASLIPVVGTALVWVPAVLYLVILAKWKSAIFLTLWCILLVGSIDNFLRPFLMKGEMSLSPFYIFLAIIGGVQYFGLMGVIFGPLILSFTMLMLYIYGVEYGRELLVEPPAPEVIVPEEEHPAV